MASEGISKRSRSPAYPFTALPKAVLRAKSLHERAGHDEVGLEIVGEAWGYGLKSSGLVQTAAALMQYGLLVDRGSRETRIFQLTPEAIRIIEDADRGSLEYKAALQRAALRPKIFAELARHFSGKDASESDLHEYLRDGRREIGEAPYSEQAAKEVIARYRETISYAGIGVKVEGGASSPLAEGTADSDKARGLYEPYDWHRAPATIGGRSSGGAGELVEQGESLLDSGLLGHGKTYRIFVRGEIGIEELEILIGRLELSKRGLTKATAAVCGDDGRSA